MKSTSLKDQLKSVVASGELVVKTQTPEQSANPMVWVDKQIRRTNMAGKSASVIASLSSIDSPELAERLSDVRNLAIKVQSACGVHSKNNRPVIAARRDAEAVINFANTVDAAITSGNVSNGDLARISKDMRNYLYALRASLRSLTEKVVEQPTQDSLMKESILHFKQSAIKLDREIALGANKMAIVIDLPVIPIFDGIVTPKTLQGVGLPAENLGGYPVLLRQRLIALDTERIEEAGLDKELYLQRALSRVNELTSTEWQFVLSTGMANNKYRLLFYWIMPEKQLSAMTACTTGSALREWGLAF